MIWLKAASIGLGQVSMSGRIRTRRLTAADRREILSVASEATSEGQAALTLGMGVETYREALRASQLRKKVTDSLQKYRKVTPNKYRHLLKP